MVKKTAAATPTLDALIKAHTALLANPDDRAVWIRWYETLAAELGRAKKAVSVIK